MKDLSHDASKADFQSKASPLEKTLICTLLEIPSLLPSVREIISQEDFFNSQAGKLFAWILAQAKGNQEISAGMAMSRFAGDPCEPYLMDVLMNMASGSDLKDYADKLRELSARRDLLSAMQKQMADLISCQDPLNESLNAITKGIAGAENKINRNCASVRSLAQVSAAWRDRYKKTLSGEIQPGLMTGFVNLDSIINGIQPADLVIIGARPSMGKTTFAMNILETLSVNKGLPTLFFSIEMPAEAIYQRSMSSLSGIPADHIKTGEFQVGEAEKLRIADEKFSAAPMIIEDASGQTIESIVATAHRIHKKQKLSAIMVDYLQLITMPKHFQNDRNNGVGEISRMLKKLAKDLNIPVLVLSQLSRDLEKRPNKRPIPADLRDSGSIEQDADIIMFVYRDEVYNPDTKDKGIAEIIVGKHRNGALGTALLGFEGHLLRFVNLVGRVVGSIQGTRTKLEDERKKAGVMSYADLSGIENDPNF